MVKTVLCRGAASLSIDQIGRVQKLCKYAISALDYQVCLKQFCDYEAWVQFALLLMFQDTPTAIENLSKALHMCQTGEEPV